MRHGAASRAGMDHGPDAILRHDGKGGITARNLGRPEGATAEETRKRLLQAAAALFARNGLHATTLGEIAGAAGLTAPAIYNHFSSKDDLFIAAACFMFE